MFWLLRILPTGAARLGIDESLHLHDTMLKFARSLKLHQEHALATSDGEDVEPEFKRLRTMPAWSSEALP